MCGIRRYRLVLPPAGVAEELFRRRVIRMLVRRGSLEEAAAAGLLSWPHSGFSVHHAIRVEPWDTEGVERLCRYLSASIDRAGAAAVSRVPGHVAFVVASLLPLLAQHAHTGGRPM